MNREKIARSLLRLAKAIVADGNREAREKKATWGFRVPAELGGDGRGRIGDILADVRKIGNNLKQGNVHADIARAIDRAIGRNGVALSRGEKVYTSKEFQIELHYDPKSRELEVNVD